jgi:hypothetical protein
MGVGRITDPFFINQGIFPSTIPSKKTSAHASFISLNILRFIQYLLNNISIPIASKTQAEVNVLNQIDEFFSVKGGPFIGKRGT